MTQLSSPQLAKQGDQEAIASLLNHLLQDKGMSAKVVKKNTSLLVSLESAQIPEQQSSVAFIHKVMTSLEVASIQSVQISGKQIRQDSPAWTEALDLTSHLEKRQEQLTLLPPSSEHSLNPLTTEHQIQQRVHPPHLLKGLQISVLVLGLVGTIYLVSSKWRKTPETPVPATSQAPLFRAEPFRVAVNDALSAAKLTQSATSKEDWNLVVHQWQQAIALMQDVPKSSPHYPVAQKRVVEYQKNLDYASLEASRTK